MAKPNENPDQDPKAESEENLAAAKMPGETDPSLASLFGITPDDLILNNVETEVVRGRQYHAGAWLHAPAHLELFSAADKRLSKVGTDQGTATQEVEFVRAALIKNTYLLAVWPTNSEDLNGIPVNRYSSSAWINLISLFAQSRFKVRRGFRVRYAVSFAPPGSAIFPALVIDLGKPLERRREPKRKKDATTGTSTRTKRQTKSTASTAAAPEAIAPDKATEPTLPKQQPTVESTKDKTGTTDSGPGFYFAPPEGSKS